MSELCITVWHWPSEPRWFDDGLKKDLALIREAGFTHLNWNPDAGSSYWYTDAEIAFIARTLKEAGLPYIVVLTHPTTGGVTASYALLGDVQIAEHNAPICFPGPRVIEQTTRETLPDGFQRAEYLLDHGMLHRVTPRTEMRDALITITRMLLNLPPAIKGHLPAPVEDETAEAAEEQPAEAKSA